MNEVLITGVNARPRINARLYHALVELASTGGLSVPRKPAPAPPRALVNHCACGQRLSDSRRYCRDCFLTALDLVIRGEASPTTLQLVLEHSTSEQRAEIIRIRQAEQKTSEIPVNRIL